MRSLPAPTKRFNHTHVDLVSPLNTACEGKNTLLTVVDRRTGWPEAFPMTMHGEAASSKACAKMDRQMGVSDIITSDRGYQFTSDLWLEVCHLLGIARDPTISYHPQHNGNVERMHRCLKNSLRARLLGRANWFAELPWVIASVGKSRHQHFAVYVLTGQQTALPGQLVIQKANIDDAFSIRQRVGVGHGGSTIYGESVACQETSTCAG